MHKAQSLTLNATVVHCSQEFVPGQTYVALSRVRGEDSLQVVDFRRKFLLIPAELQSLAVDQHDPDPDFHCCKNQPIHESFLQYIDDDRFDEESDGVDESVMQNIDENLPAINLFETNEGVTVNLEHVLTSLLQSKYKLSSLTANFINDFLEKIANEPYGDSFSTSIKSAAQYCITHQEVFHLLTKILWIRIYNIFCVYLSKNEEDVYMTKRDFIAATTKLHELFLTQEYRRDVISSFGVCSWLDLNDGQRTLVIQFVFTLYKRFTTELGNLIRSKENEPLHFKVENMGPEGRGKIRYIGGWAMRKCLENSRR